MKSEDKYKLAEKDYLDGMKYKEISEKYEVSISTVKRWKTKYNWNRDQEKSVRTEMKKVCIQKIEKNDVGNITEKQYFFCLEYIKSFNATKAYQKAYECDYNTAMVNGCKLLRNTKVKEEIKKITEECLEELEVDNRLLMKRIIEKYIAIAMADIKDFMEFGNEDVEITLDTGETKMIKVSNVNLKNDYEVDGTIISEVSKGKDGVKVKLGDRMKAMKWLEDHIGLASEEQKARIAVLKAKSQTDEEAEVQDDGFLAALNGTAKGDWEGYEDEETETVL